MTTVAGRVISPADGTTLALSGQRAVSGVARMPLPQYEPHPLLRGFHRMTLAAMFIRRDGRQPLPPVERRVFAVDASTSVVALCSWQRDAVAPVVVMVHGLAGHADRPYMRGTARLAWAQGFQVVRLNVRNCGGTEALAGTLYHAGLVDDLRAVVTELTRELPGRRLHLVGFSMGGNVVLRLGGLWGELPPSSVASLSAVSPSLDLGRCAEVIDGVPALRPYRSSFLNRLRGVYERRAVLHPERYDPSRLAGVRTLRGFDEIGTAPDCGFPDVDTYYRRASARPLLSRLRVPTLVLHARDDLLVPLDRDLERELRDVEQVRLEVTPHGGHCAFLTRGALGPGGDRSWAEHRVVAFLLDQEAGQPVQ